jgi:hypothetical protein
MKVPKMKSLLIFLFGILYSPVALSQSHPQPKQATATSERETTGGEPLLVQAAAGDAYRLVFATDYNGPRWRLGDDLRGDDRNLEQRVQNFVSHLNEAGAKGYKLIAATSGFPVAIVKFDGIPHQYESLLPEADVWGKGVAFASSYPDLSKDGYRIVEHYRISKRLQYADQLDDTQPLYPKTFYSALYVLEKKEQAGKPIRVTLATVIPGWRTNISDSLTTQVVQGLADGYRPSIVLSWLQIALEQEETVRPIDDDLRVVTLGSFGGGSIPEMVNELAQKGYRMMLNNYGAVLMQRRKQFAVPVKYIWLWANKKNFEQQLADVQARGGVYHMIYPESHGRETGLVFEQKLTDDGKRREYKVVKLDFQIVEDRMNKKVHVELKKAAKETMDTVNKLAKEGYIVRDLFLSDKVSVLLERQQ